jgi:cytochrome c553
LVFKLGGRASLPPLPAEPALPLNPPQSTVDTATIATGGALFAQFCSVCHGEAAVGGGVVPDLRTSPFLGTDAWYSIVLHGALRQGGMAAFEPVLDKNQASAIGAYVTSRAIEDAARERQEVVHKPDPSRGAVIVAQGTRAGAPACAQCHAFNGGSDASGAFPRLAGQPAAYLNRQLLDFKTGARNSTLMSQIARALSSDDAMDVSAYYASQQTPFPPLADPDPALVSEGKSLAEQGDPSRGIPGCTACHGSGGTGEAPTIPYLAGQYAPYSALQLRMWREGYRGNSPEAMRLIARQLTDRESQALAAYYQHLTPSLQASSAASKP